MTEKTKVFGLRLAQDAQDALAALCKKTSEKPAAALARGVREWLAEGGGDVRQVTADERAARRTAVEMRNRLAKALHQEVESMLEEGKSG